MKMWFDCVLWMSLLNTREHVSVCVCVCARARARACVRFCVCVWGGGGGGGLFVGWCKDSV